MAQIAVLERKCTGCGLCSESCPFGAIDMKDGKPELNAACRVCGICVKTCPEKAMIRLETRVASVDKSQWKDILVFAEVADGRLHPVSLELIGKAQELAQGVPGFQVKAVLLGNGVMELARELQHYGVSEVVAYDDPALSFFRADVFATCIEDYIRVARPSVVLVGATSLGRSLAPRLSTRFHTGLTADCTRLELRENTDLVQIRPAFGGNIMAQIVTTNTRPQFATVRYKVMDAPARQEEASGEAPRAQVSAEIGGDACEHAAGTRWKNHLGCGHSGGGRKGPAKGSRSGHDPGACGAAGRRLGGVQAAGGKGLGDQRTTDWPVRAHGASAADYHLRGERSDPVRSVHERQRTYRGHQQRRAGTDF